MNDGIIIIIIQNLNRPLMDLWHLIEYNDIRTEWLCDVEKNKTHQIISDK